jgi:hypothetical protein
VNTGSILGTGAVLAGPPPGFLWAIPETLWDALWMPFDYSVYIGSGTLTASATVISTTNIQADSHFAWLASVAALYTTAAAAALSPNLPLTVRWLDTGSGQNLDDQAQALVTRASNAGAGNPGYLAAGGAPYLLVANSTLQTTIVNLDSVNAYNLYLTYRGIKIFGVPRNMTAPPGT